MTFYRIFLYHNFNFHISNSKHRHLMLNSTFISHSSIYSECLIHSSHRVPIVTSVKKMLCIYFPFYSWHTKSTEFLIQFRKLLLPTTSLRNFIFESITKWNKWKFYQSQNNPEKNVVRSFSLMFASSTCWQFRWWISFFPLFISVK